MVKRAVVLALAVMVLALFSLGVQAQPPDQKDLTHEGKVVSITGNKLVMTDKDGKNEHTMNVETTARIFCDGKVCKLADLKPGLKIRVTTKPGEKTTAVKVEALDKETTFPAIR
jgi:hypothetical protein